MLVECGDAEFPQSLERQRLIPCSPVEVLAEKFLGNLDGDMPRRQPEASLNMDTPCPYLGLGASKQTKAPLVRGFCGVSIS